jgi:hypothetical protein
VTDHTLRKIDALASAIAKDALSEGKTLETRIDAFKALAPYYVLLFKNRAKSSDDDSEGLSFDDLSKGFAEEKPNGSAKVRSRRGPRPADPGPDAD